MKTRVMFVDDDPMLLAGTRRQLGASLPDCDFVFCQSGLEAIDQADSQSPDIVFSDVRMPHMDGPTLLQYFEKSHPDTVRFAWTGQSSQDQLARVLSVAHQVIGKPCDRMVIRQAITTVAKYRQAMSRSWLQSRLTNLESVSHSKLSLASLASPLENGMSPNDQPDHFLVVESMFKSRLLCLANSNYYSPDAPVTTTGEAIDILGSDVIKTLLTFSPIEKYNTIGVDMCSQIADLIRRGVESANRAYQLALQQNFDKHQISEVVLAAMFHQFGRIQFVIHGNEEYLQLKRDAEVNGKDLSVLERQHFSTTQATVGAYSLYIWGMKETVCQAIANLDSLPLVTSPLDRVLQDAISKTASVTH